MNAYPFILDGREEYTGDVKPVISPWTLQPVGNCHQAGPTDIKRAIDSAERGFQTMRSMRNYQRSELLHKAADIIRREKESFAVLIASEGGKPIREARSEAARAESTFRLAAEGARSWGGELLPLDITPMGGNRSALVRRFPVGIVTAISPFNFPLNLVAHKVAPALAVGCSVNVKPASSTPLSAIKLGQMLLEAGFPAGACNVIPTPSKNAAPLIEDPRVKFLTFTGSAAVGWELKRKANRIKVCLELGGNAAAIVEPDCDIEHALSRIVMGGYAHTGQICISVQHVLVNNQVYDSFLSRYVGKVKALKMGDPMEESTEITAMIDEGEAVRVDNWIKEAVTLGAKVLCGGERNRNRIIPAVMVDVPNDAKIGIEEAFAPVTVVSPYATFTEALERVNSWKYGLQAGVFTRDIYKIMTAFNSLEVGGVIIDDVPTIRVDNYPYGGVKESGFGREGVKYAMEEMTELRALVIPS